MKTILSITIILILFCAFGFSASYHVKPAGNDSNDGLSFNKAFKTIQTATNKVKAGDSVLVYDGFYKLVTIFVLSFIFARPKYI